MKSYVYKIRHSETGEFSTGGLYNKWTKNGKVWNSIGALRNHLALWQDMGYGKPKRPIPATWQLVTYESRVELAACAPVEVALKLHDLSKHVGNRNKKS